MTKLLTSFYSIILLSCCLDHLKTQWPTREKFQTIDTSRYKGLQGTWVRLNKQGFTLIEIKDTSNISYYQLIDRRAAGDTINTKYWYYKSRATMGYWTH